MKRFVGVLMIIGCSIIPLYATTDRERLHEGPRDNESAWLSLPPVFFCGEAVPVHEEAVARRLLSALVKNTNYQKALSDIRYRASTFFPIIEPILERYKIPADFKYLPLVESALRGDAVSPMGAAGYWQLMPETARELGLTVQGPYDERNHLLKSTHAACRYLRFLYDRLGSWTLAAAAYNNGIGNLLASIRKQGERDYYYLRLNAETGRYLYRILAFKELFGNYQSYRPVLSPEVWKTLSEPLAHITTGVPDQPPLMTESAIQTATRKAVDEPLPTDLAIGKRPRDMLMPNAAEVFRGGIKAQLTQAGALERGKLWLFHLTRDGMADGKPVDQGDILYAVVEDVDPKTRKVYLRADKVYSATDHRLYNLTLAAVDASSGQMGINLSDLTQVKAGWISTWKVL